MEALEDVKVLDLGWHIAGPYCTKLLADYGAQVIKVERPDGGDPARKEGPFPKDEPNCEASGLFLYLNNNKKGITLNLKTESGKKYLKELIKWADILVENFSPMVMPSLGLYFVTLKDINPGLVMVSISNFGHSGPYRDYKATDIIIQALSGWMLYRGDARREPVKAAGMLRISEFIAGAFAGAASMSALVHKKKINKGQHVDISIMEAVLQMTPYAWLAGKFPASIWPSKRHIYTPGIEQCKDGYIGLNILTGQHWVDLCGMTEMYDWAENEDYALMNKRSMRFQDVKDRMRPWLMDRTRTEIQKEAISWRVPASMVFTAEDLAKTELHRERGYMIEVDHPVAGKIMQPGPQVRMEKTPWRMKSPAPLLGQNNTEVYTGLGLDKKDIVTLKQADII